jgi:hypothetical protein
VGVELVVQVVLAVLPQVQVDSQDLKLHNQMRDKGVKRRLHQHLRTLNMVVQGVEDMHQTRQQIIQVVHLFSGVEVEDLAERRQEQQTLVLRMGVLVVLTHLVQVVRQELTV